MTAPPKRQMVAFSWASDKVVFTPSCTSTLPRRVWPMRHCVPPP
jgi:hypothetical protein